MISKILLCFGIYMEASGGLKSAEPLTRRSVSFCLGLAAPLAHRRRGF